MVKIDCNISRLRKMNFGMREDKCMNVNSIIVGAGIAGISLARRLAEEKNERIMIIEKQKNIGGFAYDYRNRDGILIHKFGPHIFRTDSLKVYQFLSRFTKWFDYQHKVLANVEGSFYPMPINLDTVNKYMGTNYTSENVLQFFKEIKTNPVNIENVKDAVESQIGETFYKAFFENYTKKQWGEAAENLPASVIARIPIRSNRDDRYFTSCYQGIPKEGYTAMLEKMLDHPNISIMLNTDYETVKNEIIADKVYYSGSIDEYYNYCFGKLPYRCVYFEIEELDVEYFQPVAVVNYPNNYDYTRITEFKYFNGNRSKRTVIAKEYSSDSGNRSYPIPIMKNKDLYNRYYNLNDNNQVTFIGRLGTYCYLSMDQIIENILNITI